MTMKVPRLVYYGLAVIRESCKVNMVDRHAVQHYASELGLHATVVWLEDNRGEYAQGITEGFEPEEDPDDDEGL